MGKLNLSCRHKQRREEPAGDNPSDTVKDYRKGTFAAIIVKLISS